MEHVATKMIKSAVLLPLKGNIGKMKISNKYFRFMGKNKSTHNIVNR